MKLSFAPLADDAIVFLMQETDCDFSRCNFAGPQWFCATARRDDGTLMGVAVGEFKNWFDCFFSCAICDPHCLSRRLLRAMFTAIFSRAVRITVEITPDNVTAERQTRRMGFVYEGFKRRGIEGRSDALMFGMLREDCRYLPGYHTTTQSVPPVALGGYHGFHA